MKGVVLKTNATSKGTKQGASTAGREEKLLTLTQMKPMVHLKSMPVLCFRGEILKVKFAE